MAMVYDGGATPGAIKSYVDGVQVDNLDLTGGTFVAIENVTSDVFIGANTKADGSIGNFFDGLIDEVRIYDVALTAGEIAALAGVGTDISLTAPDGKGEVHVDEDNMFTATDDITVSSGADGKTEVKKESEFIAGGTITVTSGGECKVEDSTTLGADCS